MGATRLQPFSEGKVSPILYLPGIGMSFVHQGLARGIYVLVAVMWLVPDRRIERVVTSN